MTYNRPDRAMPDERRRFPLSQKQTARQKANDLKTLEAMAFIFCKDNHDSRERDDAGLCPSCRAAVSATLARTEACPNGHSGNCQDCPHHCQAGEARVAIREIMRYAAPKMLFRHPVMTMRYLRKKLKK